jgi:hypothetical protein
MQSILIKFLPLILAQLSPALRELMVNQIINLREAAKKTDNPYDDFAVELLAAILTVE